MPRRVLNRRLLGLLGGLLLPLGAWGQGDLLGLLEPAAPPPRHVRATFKSSRVINLHSVETVAKGDLDFRISHRFGQLNTGAYHFFGLDQATIRLGLEYGLHDRVMIGLGRSSFEKHFDGFVKAKLLRQTAGAGARMPVTVDWFSAVGLTTLRFNDAARAARFDGRLTYTHQLIVGRKFSERFSLQVVPTLVHRNLTPTEAEPHDVGAIGVGGRLKLTRRLSCNGEYVYRLPGTRDDAFTNALSLGIDIETGGHVFQLHLTNAAGMVEPAFVTRTQGRWADGGIFYGFNVSRTFTLRH